MRSSSVASLRRRLVDSARGARRPAFGEMREPPSSPGDGRKPGQSATPCGPGASGRPYRHPIPGGAAGSERTQRYRGPARRYGLREQSGHGAGVAPPGAEQPRSGRCIRPAPDLPSWSDAHLAGDVTRPARRALAGKSASGEAHRRHRADRRTRSWRGAQWRRRAGWSCFVDRAESADRRHDPVWTVLLGRAAAAARRPSRACASRPTRACGVPLGSRQLAIEA